MIMKSDGGETNEILIDEDVYMISGDDDVEVELKEIREDNDGENVKVIVVTTDKKKDKNK